MGNWQRVVVAQGARRWSLPSVSKKDGCQVLPMVKLQGPSESPSNAWKKTLGWRRVFLPAGFPVSVSPDYGPSTAFQFIASVTGTMAGTVSTQALLQALGLGAGTALGLAASTNWIIKDGFGLLGGVLFAGVMGSRFDASPKVCLFPYDRVGITINYGTKRFRFWAAVSIQASTLLEVLTPFFPGSFLLLASVSNVGKNIGWLAASASRATMNKGFALSDNLGDVTAKAGAQGTLAGLLGTGLGIWLSWWVNAASKITAASSVTTATGATAIAAASTQPILDPVLLCAVFAPLGALNLVASYYANASVVTRSLNVERLERALLPLLKHQIPGLAPTEAPTGTLLNPLQVAKNESIVRKGRVLRVPLSIDKTLGAWENKDADGTQRLVKALSDAVPLGSPFTKDPLYRLLADSGSRSVSLWFLDGATDDTLILGMYHACLLRRLIETGHPSMSEGLMEESFRLLGLTLKERDIVQDLKNAGWETWNSHIGDKTMRLRLQEGESDGKWRDATEA
jgi:hypothetical protein